MAISAACLISLSYLPGRNVGPFLREPGKAKRRVHQAQASNRSFFQMGSKLYVGNLSYNTTSSDLEQLCSQHGTVQSAEVISDRDSGRSKGFGFVEMGSD